MNFIDLDRNLKQCARLYFYNRIAGACFSRRRSAAQCPDALGKAGPITSVKGVISSGFVLTAVLYLLIELP